MMLFVLLVYIWTVLHPEVLSDQAIESKLCLFCM